MGIPKSQSRMAPMSVSYESWDTDVWPVAPLQRSSGSATR